MVPTTPKAICDSGPEFQSVADCRFFHVIAKEGTSEIIGQVSLERQRTIGRRIGEVLRLQFQTPAKRHCRSAVGCLTGARRGSRGREANPFLGSVAGNIKADAPFGRKVRRRV